MNIELFDVKHLNDSLMLLEAQYLREQESVPALPPFADYREEIGGRLERMAQRGLGWVLTEGTRIRAMMGAYRVPEFFGTHDGAFVPAYAHLYGELRAGDALGTLYQFCAERWVRDGMTSHAVNIFAHDRAAFDCYTHLGFGLRCVDALRKTARLSEGPAKPAIITVDAATVGRLSDIHRSHCLYYRQSPMFMPTADEDPVQDLLEWIGQPDRHILAFVEGGACLGYIRLQPTGESAFSAHPSAMNITGLFVAPEARNRSIGAALLDAAQAFLSERKRGLTGVDYESINPTGARFWERFFTPYSYSLTRRIDERIAPLLSGGIS